jgi:hypothetical protein
MFVVRLNAKNSTAGFAKAAHELISKNLLNEDILANYDLRYTDTHTRLEIVVDMAEGFESCEKRAIEIVRRCHAAFTIGR